jgi:hypothetical protein
LYLLPPIITFIVFIASITSIAFIAFIASRVILYCLGEEKGLIMAIVVGEERRVGVGLWVVRERLQLDLTSLVVLFIIVTFISIIPFGLSTILTKIIHSIKLMSMAVAIMTNDPY